MIKHEKVGFLKSRIKLLQGKLILDDASLKLNIHKNNFALLGGLIGALLASGSEPSKNVFDLTMSEIAFIKQGKFGIQHVLEIHTTTNDVYKIVTKDLIGWFSVLKDNLVTIKE